MLYFHTMNAYLFITVQAFVIIQCFGQYNSDESNSDEQPKEESQNAGGEQHKVNKDLQKSYIHDADGKNKANEQNAIPSFMKAPSRRINEGLNLDELPNDESQNSGSEQQNSQEATQKDAVTTNSSYLNYKDEQGSDAEKYNVTTLANYPFAASIQRRAAHYATGALIDKNWILSCAGEFFHVRESIRLFRVRLGSVDCKQGGIIIPLTRVEIHPSYVYGEPNFDVSLLRLAHPVEFTEYIHPINLSTVRTKVISAKFMTIYWPRVIIKGKILPATAEERIKQRSMRDSTQRLIPRSQCLVKLYDANTTLHDSTLCLKSFVLYHTPCLHDAGAPVVAEDGLWGITSDWTPKDCLNQTDQSPTVFTRVSSLAVKGWLDSILNVSSDS